MHTLSCFRIFRFDRSALLRCLIALVIVSVIVACGSHGVGRQGVLPDHVDFNFHVKPILSDRCFACHGPDEEGRKAGLRLDTREGAYAALAKDKDAFAIVPGKKSKSAIWHRIIAEDPEFVMPPPESKLEMTQQEIALIGKWIDQGAEWKDHWSFLPIEQPDIPKREKQSWGVNPIDRFVLEKLDEEGLSPATEARREQLIRRLSFDLTGLPPTLEQIDRFLADDGPEAYESLVDRLLSSPAFGERMATEWLDAARYADTHGYQADRYRRMWPWRDWVIDAFNRNLPFDDFGTWQLAGDLLPDPSREQILATAFNRNHMQTEEGGSVEEEFRVEYVADRTATTARTFLGLTMECARCHDHKYDPISQEEFYQFFSFFNSVDESGQTSHFTDAVPVPTLLLSSEEVDEQLSFLDRAIRQAESGETDIDQAAYKKWLSRKSPPKLEPGKGLIGDFDFEKSGDNKIQNLVDRTKPALMYENPQAVAGRFGKGIELTGENGLIFKDLGAFSRSDPFSVSIWVKVGEVHEQAVVFHRSQAVLDAGSRGYQMQIDSGRVALSLTHMWPHNEIRVRSRQALPVGEWVHLTMTYDGASQAGGLRLFWNGKPEATDVLKDNLFKDILYERVDVNLTIGYRFRDRGLRGGVVDEFKVFDRCLTGVEAASLYGEDRLRTIWNKPAEERTAGEERELLELYRSHFDPEQSDYARKLKDLRDQQRKLIDTVPEIMVMKDLPKPRPTYILERGAYDAHGKRVEAGTPKAVLPFSAEFPPDRLGLAQWIFDSANPLTARVVVNRFWQMFFGKGIVSTPEDFGNQGALPTHPELLDWLAAEFMASGWDVKNLLKTIVMSATYRQSSTVSEVLREKDPANLLLARGPAFRLSAEMIRDQALAASGLLVNRVGGPSVKPYQPAGLWKEKSGRSYVPDQGEGLYRRSLYTFWKRTSPPPNMMTFDATERNVCVVRRQSTSTPLQALVLLNDVQFVEAARLLAEDMVKYSGRREERIEFAFRSLTSRRPTSEEEKVLLAMYEDQEREFAADDDSALALLQEGEMPVSEELPAGELAICTVLANAIMNFDEAIMRR